MMLKKIIDRLFFLVVLLVALSNWGCNMQQLYSNHASFSFSWVDNPQGIMTISGQNFHLEMNKLYSYTDLHWRVYIDNNGDNIYEDLGELVPDSSFNAQLDYTFPAGFDPFESPNRNFVITLSTTEGSPISNAFSIGSYGEQNTVVAWTTSQFAGANATAEYDATQHHLNISVTFLPDLSIIPIDWCYTTYLLNKDGTQYLGMADSDGGSTLYESYNNVLMTEGDRIQIALEPRSHGNHYVLYNGELGPPEPIPF